MPYASYRSTLLQQLPAVGRDVQPRVSFVLVIDSVHLVDRIEVAHDKRGTERLAGADRALAELQDHAHVAPLVAPGLAHRRRLQHHAGEPRPGLAALGIPHLIRADHPLGHAVAIAAVVELL